MEAADDEDEAVEVEAVGAKDGPSSSKKRSLAPSNWTIRSVEKRKFCKKKM